MQTPHFSRWFAQRRCAALTVLLPSVPAHLFLNTFRIPLRSIIHRRPPPPRTLNSCVQGALSSILSAVPADELQPLLEALGDVQLVELMLRLHGDLLPQQCRGSLQEADARRVMSMLVSLLPDMLEPHMRRQLGL